MSRCLLLLLVGLFSLSSCSGATTRGGTGTKRQALSEDSVTDGSGSHKPKVKKVPKEPGKKLPKPAAPQVKRVTLGVDEGVVFSSGLTVQDGSGLKVDLIAYRHGSSVDLKSGRVGTDNQPVHKLGNSTFDNLGEVPCQKPADSEKGGYVQLPKEGQAFTVRGNKSAGYYRVRVTAVTGTTVTLEYEACQ